MQVAGAPAARQRTAPAATAPATTRTSAAAAAAARRAAQPSGSAAEQPTPGRHDPGRAGTRRVRDPTSKVASSVATGAGAHVAQAAGPATSAATRA